MADVFISYANQERQLTADLAGHLEREGYKVWWDTGLLSGDNFRKKIDEELNIAKAVIVIWTPASVTRDWIIAEAEHAAQRNMLIPVRTSDLDPALIPKPYSTRHTEVIDNRAGIVSALKQLNVYPRYASTEDGSLHDRFWAAIENSTEPDHYHLYLKEFPEGRHVPFARLKIMQLTSSGKGPPDAKPAGTAAAAQFGIGRMLSYGITAALGSALVGAALWQGVLVPERAHHEASRKEIAAKLDQTLAEVRRHLEPDDKDWEAAKSAGLIESWNHYLARRPLGLHEASARALVADRLAKGRLIQVLEGHTASVAGIEAETGVAEFVTYDQSGWQIVWDLPSRTQKTRTRLPSIPPFRKNSVEVTNLASIRCSAVYDIVGGARLSVDSCGIGWVQFQLDQIAVQVPVSLGSGGMPATIALLDERRYVFLAIRNARLVDLNQKTQATVTEEEAQRLIVEASGRVCNRPTSVCMIHKAEFVMVRTPSRAEAITLAGHQGTIRAVAFAANGAIAISGGDDGTVRLWDLSDLK